jgi:hypothetical protein
VIFLAETFFPASGANGWRLPPITDATCAWSSAWPPNPWKKWLAYIDLCQLKKGHSAGAQLRKQAQRVFREITRFTGSVTGTQREPSHQVKLQAGKTYVIDLESEAFDTVLRLEDAAGKKLDENDDLGPGSLNYRLIFTPPQDANFRVVATAFEANAAGAYTLTIREFVK